MLTKVPSYPDLVLYAPVPQHIECKIKYPRYDKDLIACELSPAEPAPTLAKERLEPSLVERLEECYLTRQRYARLSKLFKKKFD